MFYIINFLLFFIIFLVLAFLYKQKHKGLLLIKYALLFFIFSIFIFHFFYLILKSQTFYTILVHFKNDDVVYILKYCLSIIFIFIVLLILIRISKPELLILEKSTKCNTFILIVSYILTLVSFICFISTYWIRSRFPINEIASVFFTLKNFHGDIDNGIYFEIIVNILISIIVSFIFILCISKLIFKNKKLHLFNFNFSINQILILCSIILTVTSLKYSFVQLNIKKYYEFNKIYTNKTSNIIDSKFYEKEYINPKNKVRFPHKKRNLIIILMESMESSFQSTNEGGFLKVNLIPNLTYVAKNNINFSHNSMIGGGYDAQGTGWTVAAMTSKFAGVPFNLPVFGNSNGLPDFLPNAITINDILNTAGYNQVFICGSDKKFASRDVFMETHGNVEMRDVNYYKSQNRLPKDYCVFWGFEDRKLYKYAKEDLTKLASIKKPFAATILTVDTHMPYGYTCEKCKKEFLEGNNPVIKNVIKCADRQINDFLDWIKQQPWYENTTIVIMGDHLFMMAEKSYFFDIKNISSIERRWLNIFINVPNEVKNISFKEKNRFFSSFDMFPTILASIGCKIDGNRLGLGVNLFSDEKTLFERFDTEYVNTEIMKNNKQYQELYLK